MKVLNKVSDFDFETAWASIDNQRMMRSVACKYRDFTSQDDADQLMRVALLYTLRSHDYTSRRKFITSLRLRTLWLFKTHARTEARKTRLKRKIRENPPKGPSEPPTKDPETEEFVSKLLSQLSPEEATVVRHYYMDDCSLTEISRRTGLPRDRVDQLNQSGMLKLKYLVQQG